MHRRAWSRLAPAMIAALLVIGCNLGTAIGGPDTAATRVAQTIAPMRTSLAASQTAAAVEVSPSATVSALVNPSPTFAPAPTAANPVVNVTALCWTGPGSTYPVVSSIKAGTAVEVLGVGSKSGWLVIRNPTYGDRCWTEAENLTLDPYFTTAGLEVFNPPPTPAPKVTPVPTPT